MPILSHFPSGGTDTRDATAAAADIANGKTAYVNEQKITGTSTKEYGPGDSLVDDQIFKSQAAGAIKWNTSIGTPYYAVDSCFDGTYSYIAIYNNASSLIYKYAQDGTLVKNVGLTYIQRICADSSNGHLYAIGGASSAGSYSIYHFDNSLTLLKSISLPNATSITVDENYVYVYISSNNLIEAIKKDLSSVTPIWTRASVTLFSSNDAFMAYSGFLYIATSSNGVYKISTDDGSTVWNNTTDFYGSTGSESISVNDQNVCVAAYSNVGILNQADGSLKWKVSSSAARHVCADTNFMYFLDDSWNIHKLSKNDGTQWWVTPVIVGGFRTFVDALYFYIIVQSGLYAYYKTNQYVVKG